MIRVLICDDQSMIRDGVSMLLQLEQDIVVIGTAQNGSEAVTLTTQLDPDLVLMDLKMPLMNGVEATRHIRSNSPQTRILILTTYDDDEWLFEAIRAGADGYILKDSPRQDLVTAVRGTVAGKAFVDPAIAGKLLQELATPKRQSTTTITDKLSEREISILCLIASGFSNIGIATHLHLSEGTVRNHVSAILAKLNVQDRTQAAVLAIRHGLVDA